MHFPPPPPPCRSGAAEPHQQKKLAGLWHPAAQSQNNPLQGNLLLCLTPEELGLCRRRGKCRVLCCCAPGLSSQHAAPAHPWDPRWAACDGQALEQLIQDPRDTSQQSRDGDSAAEALGDEPQAPAQPTADFFPCRQGKESVSSSVRSPPKHPGRTQQAAPCPQRASPAPQARGAVPSDAIRAGRT